MHDENYLQGRLRINAASISIRSIAPASGKWRETLEGRSSAVKVEGSVDALLSTARRRAITAKNLLVVYGEATQIQSWECY
jgi:hypothetical protein